MLLSYFWVDVVLGFSFSHDFLDVKESHFDRVIIVLEQSLLICLNRLIEPSKLEKGICFSGNGLSEFLIIVSAGRSLINCLLTSIDALIEVFHFEIYSSLVGIEGEFFWDQINSFLIEFKGLLELLLFVKVITL